MTKNTKIQVSASHKFHPNRIGYFQFMGGPNGDCVVVSEQPTSSDPKVNYQRMVLFAVGPQDYQVME